MIHAKELRWHKATHFTDHLFLVNRKVMPRKLFSSPFPCWLEHRRSSKSLRALMHAVAVVVTFKSDCLRRFLLSLLSSMMCFQVSPVYCVLWTVYIICLLIQWQLYLSSWGWKICNWPLCGPRCIYTALLPAVLHQSLEKHSCCNWWLTPNLWIWARWYVLELNRTKALIVTWQFWTLLQYEMTETQATIWYDVLSTWEPRRAWSHGQLNKHEDWRHQWSKPSLYAEVSNRTVVNACEYLKFEIHALFQFK